MIIGKIRMQNLCNVLLRETSGTSMKNPVTGVPILLNSSQETVIQYYVPYLFALQWVSGEESDSNDSEIKESNIVFGGSDSSDSEIKESNIDSSSDRSDNDKVFGSLINTSDRSEGWNADFEGSGFDQDHRDMLGYFSFQYSEDSGFDQDRHRDRLGYLSFQYFERARDERLPLMEKINEFSRFLIPC